MPVYRTRPCWAIPLLAALLTACSEPSGSATGSDAHRLEVVIPARAPSIDAGKLEAFLYTDEPPLNDIYDELIELDAQVVLFKHQQGTPTRKTVTLTGEVPEGYDVGTHVSGYEGQGGTWKRVLWDGQDGTELTPLSRVELRLLPDDTPEADDLERSLGTWQRLKEANGSAYRYDVGFASMVGEYGKTTFEVRDDEVVLRAFERRDAAAGGVLVESWTERSDELGSHTSGEPVRTVDELYAVCRNDVLTRDRFENRLRQVILDRVVF